MVPVLTPSSLLWPIQLKISLGVAPAEKRLPAIDHVQQANIVFPSRMGPLLIGVCRTSGMPFLVTVLTQGTNIFLMIAAQIESSCTKSNIARSRISSLNCAELKYNFIRIRSPQEQLRVNQLTQQYLPRTRDWFHQS
mmetsp:Transcript_11790/g.34620  ORF Transcript_11790/g.34620 Transcript_11790/m.34620 type:complete len:137 (-) Transcript_11790:157-567(-)